MKAGVYTQNGGPEVFSIVEMADPVAGPGEVLVRVEAISIEGGDILSRRGIAPTEPPRVMGYVAAGRIAALGDGVSGYDIGDPVTTFAFEGSHAELRVVPADHCWRIPEGVSMTAAAAALVTFGTAALALDLARIEVGQTVLITGAAGGVGLAAVQLAAMHGARVIGTGSSLLSLQALREYGLTDAVDTGEGPIDEQVRLLLDGGGVDCVIDNVGGNAVKESVASLAEGGVLVLVGLIDQNVHRINPVNLLLRRLSVVGCFLGPVIARPSVSKLIDDTLIDIARGRLSVPIDQIFPFSDIVAAHARAEARGRIGRVVMSV